MQVFVPYRTPLECAAQLDPRRRNKQIIECRQILAAIRGESNAWRNHPCVKMYASHVEWLEYYMFCLECYSLFMLANEKDCEDLFLQAYDYSQDAKPLTPDFLTEEFCIQHRRRLYTKDNNFYRDFAMYGESSANWYFVNGELWKYANGKRIN